MIKEFVQIEFNYKINYLLQNISNKKYITKSMSFQINYNELLIINYYGSGVGAGDGSEQSSSTTASTFQMSSITNILFGS